MNSISNKKNILREKVLNQRSGISEVEWLKKSDQIIQLLEKTDFYKKAETVHTYISMNDRREVCTDSLIEILLKDNKKVVVPKTNFSDTSLTHSELGSLTDLYKNKWGVREPENVKPVDIDEIDLVIVPMAAADKKGNRLGYGKGFYDRFLARLHATKVGLIFEAFLFDEIPVESFDEKLDVIISEEGVIYP